MSAAPAQFAPDAREAAASLRMFAGSLSTALGATPDQNYSSEDAFIGSPVGSMVLYDPYRGEVVNGTSTPVSVDSVVPGVGMTTKQLFVAGLAVGGLVWWLNRRRKKA